MSSTDMQESGTLLGFAFSACLSLLGFALRLSQTDSMSNQGNCKSTAWYICICFFSGFCLAGSHLSEGLLSLGLQGLYVYGPSIKRM